MQKQKKNQGITLIALIITIIILLILSGIIINSLTGENRLIDKVEKAKIEAKKAEYFEEITLKIADEQIERYQTQKTEAFIASLKNRIENIKDISSVVMCDENLTEQEDFTKNTVLIITTKDGYEILVDVNNNQLTATIREGSFTKVGEEFKITYDANTGNGNVEEQTIRKGFSVTLRNNEFEKTNFTFSGWCKDKDGNGEKYSEGSEIKIEEDTTLYAIWSRNTVAITYYANNGTDESKSVNVGAGLETQLSTNTYIKEGYEFVKWTTNANGTGDSYEDNDVIITSANISLYAQWGIRVTFNTNDGQTETSRLIIPGTQYGTLPTASKTHYAATWYDADNNVITETSICNYTQSTTVSIKWTWYETDPTVLVFNVDSRYGSATISCTYTNTNGNEVTTVLTTGVDNELRVQAGSEVVFWGSNWASGGKWFYSQPTVNNYTSYMFGNSKARFTMPSDTGLHFYYIIHHGDGSVMMWAQQQGVSNLDVTGTD